MKRIGYVGLGKMGINQAQRLTRAGIEVVCFNRSRDGRVAGRKAGLKVVETIDEVVASLQKPRIVWTMVSHAGVDDVLDQLKKLLSPGDIIIDGGNSLYADTVRRSRQLKNSGIRFLDAGVSGGPSGAKTGACIMIGGNEGDYKKCEFIFKAAATENGYLYVGKSGAGHFVKMIHNGIEYGMMQAIAEGFSILRKSHYKLPLKKIAGLYNTRSVIESRLVGWLQSAYQAYGENLKGITPRVAHTGEGRWTIEAAKKLGVAVPVIAASMAFRISSARHKSYAGQILSALRNQFGGHSAK